MSVLGSCRRLRINADLLQGIPVQAGQAGIVQLRVLSLFHGVQAGHEQFMDSPPFLGKREQWDSPQPRNRSAPSSGRVLV